MNITINAGQLRASLPKLIERVRRGVRFTVLYCGRRAFQIVPIDEPEAARTALEADPLHRTKAVGVPVTGGPPPTITPCSTDHEGRMHQPGW